MIPNDSKLTTIDQLSTLVDIDNSNEKLKGAAQLFLTAANDWPTNNLKEIFQFINELKQYYGSPLTKEKISAKSIDTSSDNAWKHEAGSSIVEMIDFSERFCNQSDFDKIIQEIQSYYETHLRNVDFIAELKYLTTDEGGRKTPTFSGYRPQVKFDFAEIQTSGQQTFLNKQTINPGDTVEAAIRILSVEPFANCLTEGMTFEIKEASRLVGTGRIKKILNLHLKKASR